MTMTKPVEAIEVILSYEVQEKISGRWECIGELGRDKNEAQKYLDSQQTRYQYGEFRIVCVEERISKITTRRVL